MLGTRIAALRRYRGYTQVQLAKQLAVSPSAVGMYEQGRREPPAAILVKLAAIFGVTIDFLLTGQITDSRDTAATSAMFHAAEQSLGDLYICRADGSRVLFSHKELAMLFTAVMLEDG